MRVMFGSRGCARDAYWLWSECEPLAATVDLDAFIAADGAPEIGSRIRSVPILGERDFLERHGDEPLQVYLGVGAPVPRHAIHAKCRGALRNATWPTLLHPSLRYDRRPGATRIGIGVMICAGTTLTTEVVIGDFVHVNLHCTIAHCAEIGPYSTLSPGCHVSGGVRLGERCFVGAGAVIGENLVIAAGTVIGAGATVVRDITVPGTYVGTPARMLQR